MIYTKEQIEELKQIKYVKKVSSKSIIFTSEAKIKSLKLKEEGLTPKEIFQKFGFPKYILNSEVPSSALFRWSKNKENGVIEKKKGRKNKVKIDLNNMTLEQENEYLRTKLAIYEELSELFSSGDFP